MEIWGKRISDRRSNKDIGLDVGEQLACWRNNKDGRMAGREEEMKGGL